MNLFLLNLLLAVIWASLWGSLTSFQLVTGFIVGFVTLWIAQPLFGGPSGYYLRAYRIVRLVLYFLYDLCVSSFRVAYDVITPTDYSNPKILEMPLDVKSDIEILLVTNLISLTPGTLSLDVTPDRKTLIVHAMFADDPDAVIASLKNGMERMVKEVFEE
ncbi:sodium:proton antiporter [Loktanella sp. 1ANDIMAR09]|uniref:Multisubunit sodium/proton antiporter, MrpE subunit n=1 Tax=Yoonia rosea TaxID=287098 RepID=A0A1R3WRN0_9RHOB|nr:Na+/H+ antiporter subunit E [Yoonia rosea]KQB98155.1 sodium:proton antiporter [Loktanella sp. 1ANDIMAR09]SIT79273.1 multisubunit sodium/proton antiporter, MrpE subunit [Yoonia rosea]